MENRLQHLRNQNAKAVGEAAFCQSRSKEFLNSRARNGKVVKAKAEVLARQLPQPRARPVYMLAIYRNRERERARANSRVCAPSSKTRSRGAGRERERERACVGRPRTRLADTCAAGVSRRTAPSFANAESWKPAAKTAMWQDSVVIPLAVKAKGDIAVLKKVASDAHLEEVKRKRAAVLKDEQLCRDQREKEERRRRETTAKRHDLRSQTEDARNENAMQMLQRMEQEEAALAQQLTRSQDMRQTALSTLRDTIF